MTCRDRWICEATGKPEPLFICAVIGCGRIASTTYIATEDGELAGWAWQCGDELHFCWPHAHNLYNGRDPLWEDGMDPESVYRAPR